MVDRFENTGSIDRNSVYDTAKLDASVSQVNLNAGAGLNSLVSHLDKFLEETRHQLDKKIVRKAQLAGSTAGLGPNFKEEEGNSLAVQAYNEAGLQTYLNKKVADVSTSIQKISLDPNLRSDPVRMRMALEDHREALIQDIPLSAIPDFDVAYNDRAQRAIQSAQTNHAEMVLSRNKSQFMETESILLAEITNAARQGDEETLNRAKNDYFRSLKSQEGVSMMPAEVTQKEIAVNRQIQKDAIIGQFMSTPAEQKSAFASEFITNNPLVDSFTADELDGLKSDMVTAWRLDDNFKETAEAEIDAINKETSDNALSEFHLNPTPETFSKYVQSPSVKPSDISSARNYLNKNITEPDPLVKYDLDQALYSGDSVEVQNILNDPESYSKLPRATVVEYREKLAEMKNGGGFEKTEAYKEALRRIKKRYSSAYGYSLASDGEALTQQVYDELRVKYPKYLAGELSFEDVDPLRVLKMKESNLKSTRVEGGQIGSEIKTTTHGTVYIPQKYIDDPDLYAQDEDQLLPQLRAVEVEQFIVEQKIKKMKSEKEIPNAQ